MVRAPSEHAQLPLFRALPAGGMVPRDAPGGAPDRLEADDVVIHGAPRVAALARSALPAADLVLILVQPSVHGVWASHDMARLIAEARVFRPQLRAAFMINRRAVGTVIGREARSALADQPFAAPAEISQRIVVADGRRLAGGRLACEAAPRCAAVRKIAALALVVRALLR